MKTETMRVARIYLTEGDHQLSEIVQYLHDSEKISGATVFRGIEGYGLSGKIHDSSLIDLSFNLPITVEFFDQSDNIILALEHIKKNFNITQAISWLVDQHH